MHPFCPNCGARLTADCTVCPECGSCEETGWSERARYEAMGVDPEPDEFDYESFVEREFGGGTERPRRRGILWFWVGIVLLIFLLLPVARYFRNLLW